MTVAAVYIASILFCGCVMRFGKCAETKSFDIVTTIQNRFAETTISSEVWNNATTSNEVGFHIMLPKEAFITSFDMIINGTKYEGEIEEKVKAEKIFQEAKERGKTAGIVRTEKQTNKVFKTSVNVVANESVIFTLVYQQLLRKLNGKYRHTIILLGTTLDISVAPTINVFICESQDIVKVLSPKSTDSKEITYEYDTSIDIDENWAHVEFLNVKVSEEDEFDETVDEDIGNSSYSSYSSYYSWTNATDSANPSSGSGSFIVEYELVKGNEEGDIIVDEGYLLHYFSPDVKRQSRRIVFVLDISGSMLGRKLEQQTKAMLNILDKITEQDKIGLVKFTDENFVWLNGSINLATSENIESAKNFLTFPHPSGGTYIWLALEEALKMLSADVGDEEITPGNNIIILLTDGQGSVTQSQMLKNVEKLNQKRFAIHTVGFGEYVDSALLQAIAANNHGTWKQILEGFDAHWQIQSYFEELGVTLMSGIEFEYPKVVEETFVSKDRYIYGSEIIATSRLKQDTDLEALRYDAVRVKEFSAMDTFLELKFLVDEENAHCKSLKKGQIQDFAKKAFGMVKVEKAIQKYQGEANSTVKKELKNDAIELSIEYKLVTSVTSMLIIKPEDRKELEEAVEMQDDDEDGAEDLPMNFGTKHRTAPGFSGYGDPHFIIKLSHNINICFSWPLKDERIVNLLHDAENQIIINALMAEDNKEKDEAENPKKGIYIRACVILLPLANIEIVIHETKALLVDMDDSREQDGLYIPLQGIEKYNDTYKNIHFSLKKKTNFTLLLNITINEKITIAIDVHRNKSKFHLDISLDDSKGLSDNITGFFGSLHVSPAMQDLIRVEKNENKKQNKIMPHLLVFKDRTVPVRKTEKKIPHMAGTFDCWWLNGRHLERLLGVPLDTFDEGSLFKIPK